MGANGNGGSKWIRKEKRIAIYLHDDYHCAYCACDLVEAPTAECTLDHLNTGHVDHRATNLVTACRSCNSSRQDTPLAKWAGPARSKKIRQQARRNLSRHLATAKAVLALIEEGTDKVEAIKKVA